MDVFLSAHLVLRTVEFPAMMVAMVVLWLMIIGGSIGSFLNVVVYRLPQGLSLVRPASRCPRCGTPILPRDNVPMLGWLLLRGRCRACRGAISGRYPLVELLTALAFAALALAEPLSGGGNLPAVYPDATESYGLWGTLVLHFVLFCTLLAAALMTWDDEVVPRRFWIGVWIAGFVATALLPLLRPVRMAPFDAGWPSLAVGLFDGLAGAAVGIALGGASWPASSSGVRGRAGHVDGLAAGAIVGTFLGWQAAAAVSFCSILAWALWQLLRYVKLLRVDVPWLAFLTLSTLAWLMAWRSVVEFRPDLGAAASWHLAPISFLATLAAACAGRTLADVVRRRPR